MWRSSYLIARLSKHAPTTHDAAPFIFLNYST